MTAFRPPNSSSNAPQPQRNRELEMRQAQLRQTAGIDVTAQTQALGVNGYQGPIPELDLRNKGRPVVDSEGRVSQAMALTVRSRRGGLNMQRDFVGAAHARQASSSARTDFRDEATLNFETTLQQTVPSIISGGRASFLHCVFQGRNVLARYGSTSVYFTETSVSDPAIKEVALPATLSGGINAMGVIKYAASDYLCLFGSIAGAGVFVLINNLDTPSSGILYIPSVRDLSELGFPLVTTAYGVGAFIQVGTAGNPLIVKSGTTFFVQPTVASVDWPGLTWAPATMTLEGWGGGFNFALTVVPVSGRKPKAYFVHATDGVGDTLTLNSVDVNGLNYEEPEMSIFPIRGAVAIPARGTIAMTNGERVSLWDGREKETGIFADEPAPEGQMFYCFGLRQDNGQLYATVAEIPIPDDPLPYADAGATLLGLGPIRIAERKYDFELQRWFSTSDWTTLTEEGLIRWDFFAGFPIPVASDAVGKFGYVPLWGTPDLPGISGSRHIINYIQSGFKPSLPLTPDPNTPATWIRKFEQSSGVNPYSYNGRKVYAESSLDRSPGLLFDGDALYADKYIDGVWFGGVDSGASDSIWRLWIAEYGHMDDLDVEGNRTAMRFDFDSGGNHQSRYVPSPNNFTSIMVPQFEFEQIRGDANNKLTGQYLPFTIHLHVDFPPAEPVEPTDTGRAEI